MNILHSVEKCHLNIQLQPMVVKYNTVKSKLQKDLNKYINVYLEVLYKCTCYTSADYIGLANVIYFKFIYHFSAFSTVHDEKNELELSSLNIWSFTYRKRAGGPEPRNWPELSPPTRHSVSGSAPCNKVTVNTKMLQHVSNACYCKQFLLKFKEKQD